MPTSQSNSHRAGVVQTKVSSLATRNHAYPTNTEVVNNPNIVSSRRTGSKITDRSTDDLVVNFAYPDDYIKRLLVKKSKSMLTRPQVNNH